MERCFSKWEDKVMDSDLNTVYEAAMMLPENERLALASRLLGTVPAEDAAMSLDDPSLIEELDRRFADREGSITWPELRAEE
jgi:hypothetical protein